MTKPTFTIEYDTVTIITAENSYPFTDKFKSGLLKVFDTEPSQYYFRNPLSARMIDYI